MFLFLSFCLLVACNAVVIVACVFNNNNSSFIPVVHLPDTNVVSRRVMLQERIVILPHSQTTRRSFTTLSEG